MATDSSIRPPMVIGQAFATANLDLVPVASGIWAAIPGALVTLPEAGVYEVAYNVGGEVHQSGPVGGGTIVHARMFDVTAGAAVPNSSTPVAGSTGSGNGGGLIAVYGTGSKSVFLTVAGPVTVRAEAARFTNAGAPTSFTGVFGSATDISFKKVGG